MTTLTVPVVVFGDVRVPSSFWKNVEVQPNGCWLWVRGAIQGQGYASCWDPEARKTKLGHRFIYELTVGPLDSDVELDHLCHTRDEACPGGVGDPHRLCVNPADLEPVDGATNKRRGRSPWAVNRRRTHCVNGHEFTPENTGVRADGRRRCRPCGFANNGLPSRPGVKPGSSWSPERRAAYEAKKASRLAPPRKSATT